MKTIVIPMAGKGSRFSREGYKPPKYMVEVNGKSLFEYSVGSLPINIAEKIIFICLKEHKKFNVVDFIKKRVQHENIQIIYLDSVSRGQAETVFKAKNEVDVQSELIIYNIDTYFNSSKLVGILNSKELKMDGVIGAFISESNDEKWSFAQLDKNKKVAATAEKKKISDYALTGFYHFTRSQDFFEVAEKWMKEGRTVKDEFYIAPMYNELISQGKHYILDIVDEFIPLGTPDEVRDFEAKS